MEEFLMLNERVTRLESLLDKQIAFNELVTQSFERQREDIDDLAEIIFLLGDVIKGMFNGKI